MVEESKAANDDAVTDEQFFINEELFENVVPEFGTCGKDAHEAPEENPEEQKKACGNPSCGKNAAGEGACAGQPMDNTAMKSDCTDAATASD